eukprot:UN28933
MSGGDDSIAEYVLEMYFTELKKFQRTKTTKIVRKVFSNIIENEDEEKYRKLKIAGLQKKFGVEVVTNYVTPLMGAAGFEVQDGFLILPMKDDLVKLQTVSALFLERVEREEKELKEARKSIVAQTMKMNISDAAEEKKRKRKQALRDKIAAQKKM